jgi:glycosyltransferase involved in cell wall biosynthesis
MKILQLVTSLGNGGAEKFVVELSNEMSKDNEVYLSTFRDNQEWMLSAKLIDNKVKFNSFSVKGSKNFKNIITAYKYIKKVNPKIIHVHSSLLVYYLFFLVLFFPKKSFCFTIHSQGEFPSLRKLFKFIMYFKFVGKKWTFIALSEKIKNDFEKKYPSLSFFYVENGIASMKSKDVSLNLNQELKIQQKEKQFIFIAIGNYSIPKRFDFLADIFKELSEEYPVKLIILGQDVSNNKETENKILGLNAPNVHMLGIKSNVADYLSVADALVCSSSVEGLPLVILEALSMGKPIISTPAGAIPEVVENDVNGFLAVDFSKDALKEKIISFTKLSEQEKIQIQKNNLKKFNENYTMKKCSHKYLEIYEKL